MVVACRINSRVEDPINRNKDSLDQIWSREKKKETLTDSSCDGLEHGSSTDTECGGSLVANRYRLELGAADLDLSLLHQCVEEVDRIGSQQSTICVGAVLGFETDSLSTHFLQDVLLAVHHEVAFRS